MTKRKPPTFRAVSLRSVGLCQPGEHFLRMTPDRAGGRYCENCAYVDGSFTEYTLATTGRLP